MLGGVVGLVGSLVGARDTLRDDPIGILLPAAGVLLLDTALLWVLHRTVTADGPAGVLVAVGALRLAMGAALRSRMIATGARASGMAASPWGRPTALLGVAMVVFPLSTAAAVLVGVPVAVVAALLAGRGWYATGAFGVAMAIVLGTAAALAVRSVFALAPADVVVGGRSAVRALQRCLARGPREAVASGVLVLAGDVLVGVGGLICGALALPGYPIGDLALLHRWRAKEAA